MLIDKTSFLVLVTTLAAGGAGGYLAAKKNVFGAPPAPEKAAQAAPLVTADPAPSQAAAPTPPAAPAVVCDDTSGTAGECPPPSFYSADEGGCGALPVKRCNDFKKALKPKVASQAVACLNALKPYERCDDKRSSLCGHVALMSACVDPESAKATSPTGVASTASPGEARPSSTAAACDAIVLGCAGAAMTPSLRDCRATLSGMTDAGRAGTVECMKTHCSDKGLLGCEGTVGAT